MITQDYRAFLDSRPSARDVAIYHAHRQAESDCRLGLPCDAERHGARAESAWAEWYTSKYRELQASCVYDNCELA